MELRPQVRDNIFPLQEVWKNVHVYRTVTFIMDGTRSASRMHFEGWNYSVNLLADSKLKTKIFYFGQQLPWIQIFVFVPFHSNHLPKWYVSLDIWWILKNQIKFFHSQKQLFLPWNDHSMMNYKSFPTLTL